MNEIVISEQATMSSKEIAELTGKRHDHVLRDIDKMFSDLEISNSPFLGNAPNLKNQFGDKIKFTTYVTGKGQLWILKNLDGWM